jgi:N-acyl-D-glutamate deacylase
MNFNSSSKPTPKSRREFIKLAASGIATASALSAVSTSAATEVASSLLENEPGPFDLVINGGRCVDPETGLHAVRNVGIKGGRIAAISDKKLEGTKTLNADGQIVAPGFIDLHAHGQQLPAAWVQSFDGVTTALELESGLLPVGKFYEDVAKEGRPINYGVGAAWTYARVATKEPEFDPPDATLGWFQRAFALKNWQNTIATDEELEKIIGMVEQGLKEGGLGVSINAGYAPGYGHKEYHALAELAKKHDVATFTHVRYIKNNEPNSTWDAYQEQISLAALTGAHMHVCHLNSTSLRDIEDCADLVKQAQDRGFPVTVEAYTYGAGSSAVGAEVFRGDDWLDRWGIKDASAMEFNGVPLDQAKIDEMQKSSTGDIVVIHYLRPDQSEEDQRLLDLSVLYPGGAIASDAMPWTNAKGEILEGDIWPLPKDAFAHPRSAGTFSRFIGRWVRERKAISLLEAIRKTSLIPAQILEDAVPQMKKKGRLQVGADADIVVFDLETIIDQGTYMEPAKLSAGFRHVVVNGTTIIQEGKRQGDALPGQPVRRPV